jgi:hypothetical protein
MMPLSYQGFGFTAIMLMVGVLSLSQGVKYLKEYLHKDKSEGNIENTI